MGHGAHSHKKMGKIAPGVPKRVLSVFFLLSMQRGLSATYPAPISKFFETTDVNRFPHAYTGENFRISAQEVFHIPKQPKIWHSVHLM